MSSIIKGNIQTRIFFGFMLVTLLSIIGVTVISYFVFKKNTETQNKERLRQTVEILMSSLDYAVSHTTVTEENIKPVLEKKILEISDINKQDIIIYNLQGKFLLSNKEKNQVSPQEIPEEVLKKILKKGNRFDVVEYIKDEDDNLTASYIPLLNNMLEPVAIVFFPFFHSDNTRLDTFNQYIQIMVAANIVIIALGIWLSWRISDELTKNIRKISQKITQIDLNEEIKPIRYYNDDEFTPLINSYNRTIRMIEEQKKLLFFKEKESAWREMAKQVAHEVKNPLTPMKLLIQNFERKFDKNEPEIEDKVKKLCASMEDQIDLIAKVAGAFSEFTKLPEKKNEVINVNNEILSLIRIFDDKNIYYSSQFILEKIEDKFGEVYNREFIKDLRDTIETMEYKYDEFSFAILEDDFYEAVKEAKSFNEIKFSYYGSDWKIDSLNENIKNNKYEISNEKVNSWDKRSQGIGIAD